MAATVAPEQQVIEQEPSTDKHLVRTCGPLPLGSAMAYATAIPSERRSVTGCYLLKYRGCPIGCTYNIECSCCNCLWTPSCCLPFCALHMLGSLGQCFNNEKNGTWAHVSRRGVRNMWIYEVDSDTHTLAVYHAACCADPSSAAGNYAPCFYCVRAC